MKSKPALVLMLPNSTCTWHVVSSTNRYVHNTQHRTQAKLVDEQAGHQIASDKYLSRSKKLITSFLVYCCSRHVPSVDIASAADSTSMVLPLHFLAVRMPARGSLLSRIRVLLLGRIRT